MMIGKLSWSPFLIGHGAAALGRRLRAARLVLPLATIFFALAAGESLMNEWFSPRFWRDDYRGIAHEIGATAGPNDAILVMGLKRSTIIIRALNRGL
jgi:mannosyltransferase